MSVNSSSSGSGNGGGGSSCGGAISGSGGGGPCGACKFLRRKCVPGCIFAPYFDSEQGATHFAAVHKVFGASNVSKLLLSIPAQRRVDAVVTICYEAQARLRDPVYGCVSHIFALQQQVVSLQTELSYLQGHLETLELPQPPPPPPPPQVAMVPPALSFSDLPSATVSVSSFPGLYDISSFFDPMAQTSWPIQSRSMDLRHYLPRSPSITVSADDMQALARELLQRHGSGSAPTAGLPCSNVSSSSSLSK